MSPPATSCTRTELVGAYALEALPAGERTEIEQHIATCGECKRELEMLHSVISSLDFWPTDVLRPSASLQGRLASRIAAETGKAPVLPPIAQWNDPDWQQAAPGIFCKLLSSDDERNRVSMLVRLLPGVAYPAHTHAGVEELHLLDGELWIEERKLHPGDYNRAEAGSGDKRVWSETGCTCLLVTSTQDLLR